MRDILVAETILSIGWWIKKNVLDPDGLADIVLGDLRSIENEDHRRAYLAGLEGLYRSLGAVVSAATTPPLREDAPVGS